MKHGRALFRENLRVQARTVLMILSQKVHKQLTDINGDRLRCTQWIKMQTER